MAGVKIPTDSAKYKKLLALLRDGNTRQHASLGSGISNDTFSRRFKDDADFAEEVIRAEAFGISKRVGTLKSCIDGALAAGDFATAGRLTIEYLKRKDKANWSERIESTGADGEAMQVTITPSAFRAAVAKKLGKTDVDKASDV